MNDAAGRQPSATASKCGKSPACCKTIPIPRRGCSPWCLHSGRGGVHCWPGASADLAEGEALADRAVRVRTRPLRKAARDHRVRRAATPTSPDSTTSSRPSPASGWPVRASAGRLGAATLEAEAIGLAAMRLGAGRATKEDHIDPNGRACPAPDGGPHRDMPGDVLATLYTQRRKPPPGRWFPPSSWNAFSRSARPRPTLQPVIYETIGLDF